MWRPKSHDSLKPNTCESIIGFLVVKGKAFVRILPIKYMSRSTGYVTSPIHGSAHSSPERFSGEITLQVKNNESIFITFSEFMLEYRGNKKDALQLTVLATGDTWTKWGHHRLPAQVIPSSVKVCFFFDRTLYERHSAFSPDAPVFKMLFAILPKSKEPKMVVPGIHNCTVPHFSLFKELLECNMVVECIGKEDERNCSYQSAECGEDMIDGGRKCYKILPTYDKLRWVEASSLCTENGYRLVTFPTELEFESLIQLMVLARIPAVYVGARRSFREPILYKNMWRWADGRTAFGLTTTHNGRFSPEICVFLRMINYYTGKYIRYSFHCLHYEVDFFLSDVLSYTLLCETDKPNRLPQNKTGIALGNVKLQAWNVSITQCPAGHVTRDFLSCDVQSQCGMSNDQNLCTLGSLQVPMFECHFSRRFIHFTLVCDYVSHCSDGSDEHSCYYQPCKPGYSRCTNGQCFPREKFCNLVIDCFDGTDEGCGFVDEYIKSLPKTETGRVDMDGTLYSLRNSTDCPATHFLCPFGYCLPIFLRCNDIVDCPGREDEAECYSYTCPGFYRCLGAQVCLHPDHVCDGVWQCPKHDDELLCDPRCPDVCHCHGLAFVCHRRFNTNFYPDLRLLDASKSDLQFTDIGNNLFLIHLNMSRCDVGNVDVILKLPNLKILDLGWNKILHLDLQSFKDLGNLEVLILSCNPLFEVISGSSSSVNAMQNFHSLDLSNTSIRQYNSSSLSLLANLKRLNLSYSSLSTISDEGFSSSPFLQTLDVRGSSLRTFPIDMLRDLTDLNLVFSSHYKLCCQEVLPDNFEPQNCHTRQNSLSSCEELIRSGVSRVFVSTFAVLATAGNVCSVWYRILHHREGNSVFSVSVFITNLECADFLMGIYLMVITAADFTYRGDFLLHDNLWKEGTVCTSAGVVCLLSRQVSVFTIFLLTLDRVLMTLFPFKVIHFQKRSALITCGFVWSLAFLLALLQVLRVGSLRFFVPTAMCVPLPFSACDHLDYFSMLILANFVLIVVVACGLMVIHWPVQSSSLLLDSNYNTTKEAAVSRRLTTVIVSNLLCWFLIGLIKIVACTDVHISDGTTVATVIFLLPVNSAFNPLLYAYNNVVEKNRKVMEEHLLKMLHVKHSRQICHKNEESESENRATALAQVRVWVRNKIISSREIQSCGTMDLH